MREAKLLTSDDSARSIAMRAILTSAVPASPAVATNLRSCVLSAPARVGAVEEGGFVAGDLVAGAMRSAAGGACVVPWALVCAHAAPPANAAATANETRVGMGCLLMEISLRGTSAASDANTSR